MFLWKHDELSALQLSVLSDNMTNNSSYVTQG